MIDLQARWEMVLVQYVRVTDRLEAAYQMYYEHLYSEHRTEKDVAIIDQLGAAALVLADQMVSISQEITAANMRR